MWDISDSEEESEADKLQAEKIEEPPRQLSTSSIEILPSRKTPPPLSPSKEVVISPPKDSPTSSEKRDSDEFLKPSAVRADDLLDDEDDHLSVYVSDEEEGSPSIEILEDVESESEKQTTNEVDTQRKQPKDGAHEEPKRGSLTSPEVIVSFPGEDIKRREDHSYLSAKSSAVSSAVVPSTSRTPLLIPRLLPPLGWKECLPGGRQRKDRKSYRGCCVPGCDSKTQDLVLYKQSFCELHVIEKAYCICRFDIPFNLKSIVRSNAQQTAMFHELIFPDEQLLALRTDPDMRPVDTGKICSQHFHRSMTGYVYAFPILGLNKTRRRIRLIAKKYGLEVLLPDDFDTMSLEKDTTLRQFELPNSRQHGVCAKHLPMPLRPSTVESGKDMDHLMYSTDDEDYGVNGTAKPPSVSEAFECPEDRLNYRRLVGRRHMDTLGKFPPSSSPPKVASSFDAQRAIWKSKHTIFNLHQYLERLGCTVYHYYPGIAQLSVPNKCSVIGCGLAIDAKSLRTIGLFASLPTNIEVALHCIAVAFPQMSVQNMWMGRLIDGAADNTVSVTPQITDLNNLVSLRNKKLTQNYVKEFPLIFCIKHFQKDVDGVDKNGSARGLLVANLPVQEVIMNYVPKVQKNKHVPNNYDRDLFQVLRRRWILEQCSLQNSELIPFSDEYHNEMQTPSWMMKGMKSHRSLCIIPGCSGRYVSTAKRICMIPIPREEKMLALWQNRIRDALHISIQLNHSNMSFLCEQHFECYLFAPSIVGKSLVPDVFLSVKFNPYPVKNKPDMQKCGIRCCPNNAYSRDADNVPVRFYRFPEEGTPERLRWADILTRADPSCRVTNCGPLWACQRHFACMAPGATSTLVQARNFIPTRFLKPDDFLPEEEKIVKMQKQHLDQKRHEWEPVTTNLCTEVWAPGGKHKCCFETAAVQAKILRLAKKSVDTLNLLKQLQHLTGMPMTDLPEFDEIADDVKMYGEFGAINSLQLAKAINEMANAPMKEAEQENMQENADPVNNTMNFDVSSPSADVAVSTLSDPRSEHSEEEPKISNLGTE